jgi:hypothetical protein
MARSRSGGRRFGATRVSARILLLGILAFATTGCAISGLKSQRLSRSVTIHGHHFDPPTINVPANTPFDLAVSANDMAALTISSPLLGFETISVPPLRRPDGTLRPLTFADFRTVRIPIAALSVGEYEMSCQCHGRISVGKIVVR